MQQLTSNGSLKKLDTLTVWQSWNAVIVYLTSKFSYDYEDNIKIRITWPNPIQFNPIQSVDESNSMSNSELHNIIKAGLFQ